MGIDINVYLLEGYRIPLSVAFEYNLLDRNIVESDDYQLIHVPEYRNEIIRNSVTSDVLREFLLNNQDMNWNIRIVTSSQKDCKPNKSYMYLYDTIYQCYEGTVPDYKCGTIDHCRFGAIENTPPDHYLRILLEIKMPDNFKWQPELHWVVEGYW